MRNNPFFPLFLGLLAGALLAAAAEVAIYKKYGDLAKLEELASRVADKLPKITQKKKVLEDFSHPVSATTGQGFGQEAWLTMELFRNGTFLIDGSSGLAVQRSGSYRDSAIIRSTQPLPKTYKIWAIVGEIDYGLEKISGLPQDPEYPEGPQNENGCYLLSIVDENPQGHHTNTWWHQHRKVVMDVDNNIWGHGAPNPIFMVHFNRDNRLRAFDGQRDTWQKDWKKAATYDPRAWYKVEIEKTSSEFIMSLYHENGELIKRGRVALKEVWNADDKHPDYLVIGDPHENYYQGSIKIKEIGGIF